MDVTTYSNHFYIDERTNLGVVVFEKSIIAHLNQKHKNNSTLDLGKRVKWLLSISSSKNIEHNFKYWNDKNQTINETYEEEKLNFKDDIYLALNWFIIFSFLNDKRKDELKTFLTEKKFNHKDIHGIGGKIEACIDFFTLIGEDGNIEMKGKDETFFNDRRKDAISIYEEYQRLKN